MTNVSESLKQSRVHEERRVDPKIRNRSALASIRRRSAADRTRNPYPVIPPHPNPASPSKEKKKEKKNKRKQNERKEFPTGREGGEKEKQTRKAPTARFPRFLKSLESGRADDMPCAPSRVDLFLRLPRFDRYCRGLDLKIVILLDECWKSSTIEDCTCGGERLATTVRYSS